MGVPHRPKVTFRQSSTASANYNPGSIFKPALLPTIQATAERRFEPIAQTRPSTLFATHKFRKFYRQIKERHYHVLMVYNMENSSCPLLLH